MEKNIWHLLAIICVTSWFAVGFICMCTWYRDAMLFGSYVLRMLAVLYFEYSVFHSFSFDVYDRQRAKRKA